MRSYCEGCFEKQRKIDALTEEIKQLKAKLKYLERKEQEGYFGSSTPSSKVPFKANTPLRISTSEGVRRKVMLGMVVKALMNRKQTISFNWSPR